MLPEARPQLAMGLSWGLNFVLGFVLACAKVFGAYGPFGIAAVAQASGTLSGMFCAIGASLGYFIAFGFGTGLKYVAAVVLVFTAAYVFRELPISRRAWFMPAVALFFTALAGFLGAIETVKNAPIALGVITESVLAMGGTYFFRIALSTEERDSDSADLQHALSLAIFLACILIAIVPVMLFGVISVGRFFALILVMTAAFKGGALSGAAAGAAIGIALDIAYTGDAFFAMAYAFSGLISGLFARRGKLVFILCFVVASFVAVVINLSSGSFDIAPLFEVFAASVIFMLLPNSFLTYVGSFLREPQASASEAGLRRYTAKRIMTMSEAFQDLYDTVDANIGKEQNDEDISKVFDRAANHICIKCKSKNDCWNANYMDTLAAFNDTVPAINSRGLVEKGDLPSHFTDKCPKGDELVGAINGELRARMYRRQYKMKMTENRTAAYSQYADMSKILETVSDELSNTFGPDALAQRRLSRYLDSIDVNADISVFRDKIGRLRISIEGTKLSQITKEGSYLDKLSSVVGVRLCRPGGQTAEGRISLMEAEPLTACVGIATMKKKGESVSGDRGTYFKTDQGVLCVILSDGMGSGVEAAKESVSAVRILERFLKSGVDPAVAMKMLNSMMLLKNGDQWGFATVDLMCIDLFTGETCFYKYGAAPSYVRSGKSIKQIRNDSLAAGLVTGAGSEPDIVRMHLKAGNVALVASDGVFAQSDDSWIHDALLSFEGDDTKKLAKDTLQMALSKYGCTDDMTVLAVRIENRE